MRISRIYLQINNIKRIIRARAVINDITYTTTMPVIITNGPNNAFNGIFKFVSCSERALRFFQEPRFSGNTPLECTVRFLIRSLFKKLALKGIVHPKMNILPTFTHSHVSNLYDLIVMCNPIRYFE